MAPVIVAEASDHPERHPLVPWWSVSKTMLAAAALALVDRRRLDLDARVDDQAYTLRHLLQHTSGLTDYGPIPEYHQAVAAGETPWTIDDLLARASASTLRFAPGTQFSYSNIGYLRVRQILEHTLNDSLDNVLRTLVFDPLGIKGTFVANSPSDFDAIVWTNARGYDPRWVYHGCVVGSVSSAATCMHRLMHGQLLAPATKLAMLRPRSYGADAGAPPDSGYGLGVMIEPKTPGEVLAGHAGGGPGSTIVVFSSLTARRTFAVAAGDEGTDTFQSLMGRVRALC